MRTLAKSILVTGMGLLLAVTLACSQKLQFQNLSEGAGTQQLPFRTPSDQKGVSPTAALVADGIPAGTPILVRLQSRLSSASSHTGDKFQAVLASPLVVHGRTLALKGTVVEGQVLASKPSQSSDDPGYLRITLTAITLDGKVCPIGVSTIFSKAEPGKAGAGGMVVPPSDVEFLPNKHLFFRLTRSLPLA